MAAVTALVGWVTWQVRWARLWGFIGLTCALAAGVVLLFAQLFLNVRRSSEDKAIIGNLRQLSAAVDQFYLESGFRVFVAYNDIVGTHKLMNCVDPVAGEDYRTLFPRRQEARFIVRRADGGTVQYETDYPDQPPRPDGEHSIQSESGGRIEISYRNGVPHGPFRLVQTDGRLRAETTYIQGRVTGPCWIYTADGTRYNELTLETDGPRALGQRKTQAGDHTGAIEEYTRAIELNGWEVDLYLERAAVRQALGDLDGAIADHLTARSKAEAEWQAETRREIDRRLQTLYQQRGLAKKKAGNPQAATDLERGAPSLLRDGAARFESGDLDAALVLLDQAVEQITSGGANALRADIRAARGDLDEALADYTRALALETDRLKRLIVQYKRGHIRRLKGDLIGAAEDFRPLANYAYFSHRPDCGDAALWLFLVEGEGGRHGAATAELGRLFASADKSRWPQLEKEIARLLLGHVTEAQLRAVSFKVKYVTIPFKIAFHSAMLHRQAGDRMGALERFREARAHFPQSMASDYVIEQGEIERAIRELEDEAWTLPPAPDAASAAGIHRAVTNQLRAFVPPARKPAKKAIRRTN
jgi:tetratricopeptide (TPR) repeat protein